MNMIQTSSMYLPPRLGSKLHINCYYEIELLRSVKNNQNLELEELTA